MMKHIDIIFLEYQLAGRKVWKLGPEGAKGIWHTT